MISGDWTAIDKMECCHNVMNAQSQGCRSVLRPGWIRFKLLQVSALVIDNKLKLTAVSTYVMTIDMMSSLRCTDSQYTSTVQSVVHVSLQCHKLTMSCHQLTLYMIACTSKGL